MESRGSADSQSTLPEANAVAVVEGVLERIVYESPESGFFVGRLRVQGAPELVTFVGEMMAVSPGETLRLRGRWVDDRKFGKQLRAESYETVRPTSLDGIENYLGSGLIKGIGPTYAKRLVDAFGTDTLRVIDEQPQRLRTVEGIGSKRAKQIRESWEEQKAIQSIMVFLQGHGISAGQAVKIYQKYGDRAVAVLRENPYRLARDVTGIGFGGADAIAHKLGIDDNAAIRYAAGLAYALQDAANEGHTCLNRDDLFARTVELLKADDPPRLEEALRLAIAQHDLVTYGERIMLPLLERAEDDIARALRHYAVRNHGDALYDGPKAAQWVEKYLDVQLSPEQRDCVVAAAVDRLLVITGGPGTGKTTIVKALLEVMERKGMACVLAAPTGRAAKRMHEATGRTAKTLHRLLEFVPQRGGFTRDENHPIDADLLIVDETSMVDATLFAATLRALPYAARLVLVGDVDQLPSVGPGNVLFDILASNTLPVVRLETVFRQASESGIIANAHRINRGQTPHYNDIDFFFIERNAPELARQTILTLVAERMPKKFGFDPVKDIQVMAPMHRGDAGVARLNETLQQALNPNGAPLPRRDRFRVGDKVIQTRNNYELDAFNGDVGYIVSVDADSGDVLVVFDTHEVVYPLEDLDDLSLAYAVTIHKAQGSEYPAVVVPLLKQHFMMLQRNVLYTAITRARQVVVLVGEEDAIRRAVKNTEAVRRHTSLADRLREIDPH